MDFKIDLFKILVPTKKLGALKLKEEDQMCIQFANYLRELTFNTDFPFVWFHVPNQFASQHPIFGLKQSWMGRIAGIPDYIFLGKNSFGIEFKSSRGKLSSSQEIVREWFENKQINFYIACSFNEAIDIINKEWRIYNK